MEEYKTLMNCLKLTPAERRVCDLKYVEGLNFMEIGDRLGYSESGIKKIHGRALNKIARVI